MSIEGKNAGTPTIRYNENRKIKERLINLHFSTTTYKIKFS